MYTSPISKLLLSLLAAASIVCNPQMICWHCSYRNSLIHENRTLFKSLVQPPTFGHMLIALAMETFLLYCMWDSFEGGVAPEPPKLTQRQVMDYHIITLRNPPLLWPAYLAFLERNNFSLTPIVTTAICVFPPILSKPFHYCSVARYLSTDSSLFHPKNDRR